MRCGQLFKAVQPTKAKKMQEHTEVDLTCVWLGLCVQCVLSPVLGGGLVPLTDVSLQRSRNTISLGRGEGAVMGG